MSYTVFLTDTAKQDIREIAIWIAEQSKDIEAARRFVKELRGECKKLDAFPGIGSIPNDRILKSFGYRFIAYNDYLVFYLVDEELKIVNIMAVFNSKRNYMRVMKRYI